MTKETQDFLVKQMSEKDEKKTQAQRLKTLYAGIMTVDTAEYKEGEEAKAEERKRRYREHQQEL